MSKDYKKYFCPECGTDCKNKHNLAAHIKSKHPNNQQKPKVDPTLSRAEKMREYVTRHTRASSASIRDIAPLPDVVNPARRAAAAKSLLVHCQTYHPNIFKLPFARVHRRIIDRLEKSIIKGGLYALACPRGTGKSALCTVAVEWAIVNGYRKFVVLVAAETDLARDILDKILGSFECNDLLNEDYPEVCYPFRRLEHIVQRTKGQTFDGNQTEIGWTADELRLATIPGSASSGSVIRCAGLLGAIRGMSVRSADGGIMRPDCVIVDDPQTRQSAPSLTQVRTRLATITSDILGLAGPDKQIACVVPCTVIAPGDVADQLTNRKTHPQWNGERSKLVEAFPVAEKLWEEYFTIRSEALQAGAGTDAAREFYRANRVEMDEGCVVTWPERYDTEVYDSAIEQAMCWRHDNPAAFACDAQNEPILDEGIASGSLDPVTILGKTTAIPRGIIPADCTRLTAGIDVHKDILYYVITAWTEEYGGQVVDYGTFPKQNRQRFMQNDPRPGLGDVYPQLDEQARVYAALAELSKSILTRNYSRHQVGGELRVEKLMVDSQYNTDLVKKFCRESQYGSVILPSGGEGITATRLPMAQRPKRDGVRAGDHWRLTPNTWSGKGRLCSFDSNYWKSFIAQRLLTPPGSQAGCLLLPDGDNQHFVDHLVGEYRVLGQSELYGRKVEEWKPKPGHDNHWFDALILCAVGSSVLGLKWNAQAVVTKVVGGNSTPAPVPPTKPKVRRSLAAAVRAKNNGGEEGGFPTWMNRS